MNIYVLFLIASVLVEIVAQIALKYGMRQANIQSFTDEGFFSVARKVVWNLPILCGLCAMGLRLVLWLAVLSRLDLSYAYPIMSASYLGVALASKFIFKENISMRRWLSVGVIMVGVIIVGLS